MKKHLALLLVLGLVVGSFAATAQAAKKKKKKKPVPIDLTYHLVWGGEACALSVTADAASEEDSCADPFWGLVGDQLGGGPALAPAVDGLPLTVDTTKPVTGTLYVQSWYLTGEVPDVMGIGQPQIEIKLTGMSAGEELVIGEHTTDAYTVTPAEPNYTVEFEFEPSADVAKKVFEELTLSLEVVGNSMFHGVFPADGTSTMTLGGFGR